MLRHGIDYESAPFSTAEMHGIGASFVARYLSRYTSKVISPGEARVLTHAGLDIVVVFEDGAQNALGGRVQGRSDASVAADQAARIGKPANAPIYFAIDWDAGLDQQGVINDYFRGVADVLGVGRAGAYGGFWPLHRLFNNKLITYGWQTYAWSGGNWDSRAQLQQDADGNAYDWDRSWAGDFGQWRVGQSRPKPRPPGWFLIPDERHWLKEYDDLYGHPSRAAAKVRARVIVKLTERRKRIWVLAQASGFKWHIANRGLRYAAIKRRTEDYRRTGGLGRKKR